MIWFALAIRCLLSVVFLAAGSSKLLDLKGSRKAITDFGLPAWTSTSLGIGIPIAEILVGCSLLPLTLVALGAFGALLLSLAFSAAIAINIKLGRSPECHCFGQVHSAPIGWGTFTRSAVLAGLAAFLVWHARIHTEYEIASISAATLTSVSLGLVVLAAFGTIFWLLLQLFRQNGRLLLRIEALEASQQPARTAPARPVLQGLPLGAPAIPFELPSVSDGITTLAGLLGGGKPLLMISTNPKCGPCDALMPEVANWQKSFAEELTIVLLSHGRLNDNRAKAAEHGISNVLVEPDHKIAEQYGALGTPTAVIIRSDGTIGSPAMGGAEAIRKLVTSKAWTDSDPDELLMKLGLSTVARPPRLPTALPAGSMAPTFTLPDLNGNVVQSSSFVGMATVMLFWNPECGFCQTMLPQLQKWENTNPSPSRSPRLVLISSGALDVNQTMQLQSTVVVDNNFEVGRLYGVTGTPSAVLIDAKGKVASAAAVGEPAVFQLLQAQHEPRRHAQHIGLADVS
jgi:thiol-disulfide isomerase/thioredoxin